MISVVVPIGPYKSCIKWLDECIQSVCDQIVKPDEIVIIDDMADPNWKNIVQKVLTPDAPKLRWMANPWRLGIAASFNIGVAYAENDLVFMLGSDDKLLPHCIEECLHSWSHSKDPIGYYHVDVVYDNGETQNLPCHAAMVSKSLWRHIGGFPPESAIGAMDASLISVMLAHREAGHLIRVGGDSQYWVRRHADQDTAQRGLYQGAISDVRNILTATWKQPEWGRYE